VERPRTSFRAGARAGVPFAVAAFALSLTFGVLAREAGFSAVAAIAMSALVFAGSAQFAAVSILAAGGGALSSIGAAALINSRFLPMGVAFAASLPGPAPLRALQAFPIVDSSWAASRGDGTYDCWFLFGMSGAQYVMWIAGTATGALGGDLIGDPERLGLDAIFPTFFLALLLNEVRGGRARGVAALGALVALALVPVAPPGVPVLVASLAALAGAARR